MSLTDDLAVALGNGAVLTGDAAIEKAKSDWSRPGTPLAVVRPSSTEQVAEVVRLCAAAAVPVVPWGGKTGLVHGIQSDGAIALSLERMAAIEEIDAAGGTMTVQAGCILQTACEAVEAQGLSLPIDLGARGSATIGGVISTNAGGNRVLRYGMTRDLVLGLEVVLADGTIWSSLNRLIKNNAGYDLKHLFIGAEGTLGIVTRAVMRLRPAPLSQDTAFVGCASFDKVAVLLRHMERGLGGALSAYEVMWAEFVDLVTSAPALGRSPLEGRHSFCILIEAQGADAESDAARFEAVLGEAFERGLIEDAALAKSKAEREAMWALRDDIGQTARNWPIFTYDVSLRITEMESYVAAVRAALCDRWQEKATLTVFGHLGDGNLHLVAGVGARDKDTKRAVDTIVYGEVAKRSGSVSAEHGIGLEKRDYLGWSRSPAEVDLMRRVKAMLDPAGLFNPGKVLA